MTRSPDRDDRKVIVKLAEGGTSVRRIAKITKWSRPTISKVLAGEGFDPNTKRVASGSPEGVGGAGAPTFDFEAEMRAVDEELKQWWDSLTDEEREQERAKGPEEARTGDGGFLDRSY